MQQRQKAVTMVVKKHISVTAVAQSFGISRKTLYKWLDVYHHHGIDALSDRSRAPHVHPNQTANAVVTEVLTAKLDHPSWGPKKLVAYLSQHHPETSYPASSTAGDWLKKHNLVKPRRRRRTVDDYTPALLPSEQPNDTWCIDFKGQFRTKDSKMCYPLTLTDHETRYLLICHGMAGPTYEETRRWLHWAFHEYGLPRVIRSDNGVPFATTSIGGLSRLSVELIRLGIIPERIAKAKPSQNGRHERMHRTLKDEVCRMPSANLSEQQLAFEAFRRYYNEERPHEAIGQHPPASIYTESPRPYPSLILPPQYDTPLLVRGVRIHGDIMLCGKRYYLTPLLAGEWVGLLEVDDGLWSIYYYDYPFSVLNLRSGRIEGLSAEQRRKEKACRNRFLKYKV
jgi:transposase InsO family protein